MNTVNGVYVMPSKAERDVTAANNARLELENEADYREQCSDELSEREGQDALARGSFNHMVGILGRDIDLNIKGRNPKAPDDLFSV